MPDTDRSKLPIPEKHYVVARDALRKLRKNGAFTDDHAAAAVVRALFNEGLLSE